MSTQNAFTVLGSTDETTPRQEEGTSTVTFRQHTVLTKVYSRLKELRGLPEVFGDLKTLCRREREDEPLWKDPQR